MIGTAVQAEDDTLLIDVKEVARILCTSTKTVERMVKAGKFPQPIKLNERSVRWSRETVSEWVKQQTALRA